MIKKGSKVYHFMRMNDTGVVIGFEEVKNNLLSTDGTQLPFVNLIVHLDKGQLVKFPLVDARLVDS